MPRPIIQVEGLHYSYGNGAPALAGIDLTIAAGDYAAIVGQNGSGKTTLVKHFNGLLKPTRGRVLVDGADTARRTIGELARLVGYVFQNPDHQLFCATTREELAFGPRNLGLGGAEVQERTEEALVALGLQAYAESPPAILGLGLRRQVAVASVYAMRPRVLILDEPTAGLDWRATLDLMALIGGLHQEGHTILLITHDMRLVAGFCPRTLVLHQGQLLADGPTRVILPQRELLAAAGLEPPQITALAGCLAPLGLPPDLLTVGEFCAAYAARLEAQP